MDYNTFERAVLLIKEATEEELKESKIALSRTMRSMNEEKRMLSNDIRFSLSYYSINMKSVEEKIADIEKELPFANELILSSGRNVYEEAQSRMVIRVKEMQRDTNRLKKKKGDYQNKVKRLSQDLIDLYLEIERTRRKTIYVANALFILENAAKHGIYFNLDDDDFSIKNLHDFFLKLNILK